jgi:hypothetical protein
MVVLVVLQVSGLLIHQRRGDRAVGLLLLLVLRKQLLCAFLSFIFLCGMMPFFVVGVLPMLEMQVTPALKLCSD